MFCTNPACHLWPTIRAVEFWIFHTFLPSHHPLFVVDAQTTSVFFCIMEL